METEGCLAIYKRANSSESFIFILNRLAPENFLCSLSDVESAQLEGDLLMLLLNDSRVMGIWLFDEKERHIALSVLQGILAGSPSSDSDSDSPVNPQQLKPISVTDLLGGKTAEKTPNILDLLSKAKIKDDHETRNSSLQETNALSLEDAISNHFASSTELPPTSLKSFTSAVCTFLQENPQLLAAAHRKLVTKTNNNNNK